MGENKGKNTKECVGATPGEKDPRHLFLELGVDRKSGKNRGKEEGRALIKRGRREETGKGTKKKRAPQGHCRAIRHFRLPLMASNKTHEGKTKEEEGRS